MLGKSCFPETFPTLPASFVIQSMKLSSKEFDKLIRRRGEHFAGSFLWRADAFRDSPFVLSSPGKSVYPSFKSDAPRIASDREFWRTFSRRENCTFASGNSNFSFSYEPVFRDIWVGLSSSWKVSCFRYCEKWELLFVWCRRINLVVNYGLGGRWFGDDSFG